MLLRLRFLLVLIALVIGTTAALQAQSTTDNVWYGEFYPKLYFAGDPVQQTYDGDHLKLYWGFGTPHPEIPSDYFSSRFRHYLTLNRPMRYRIVTRGDDGYRIFVDGNLVLDQLAGIPLSRHTIELNLSAGRHAVYVEHYEMVGNAALDIQLYPIQNLPNVIATQRSSPTPQPSPTPVPTETPTPFDPNAPISIEAFTIAPNPAVQGGGVTVSWRVRNATTVDIVNYVPRGRYTEPVIVYIGPENMQSVQYTLDASDVTGSAQFDIRAYNNVDLKVMTVNLPFDCTLRWFFRVDQSADRFYGCPTQESRVKKVTEQRFEKGWMVLFDELSGADSVLVFVAGGDIRIFPLEASADPDPTLTPPAGRFQPVGTFSGTWQRYRLQTELGWASTPLATRTDTYWQGTAYIDTFYYLFGSAESDTIWVIDQRNFTWSRYQP
jgi:hypothetical protein